MQIFSSCIVSMRSITSRNKYRMGIYNRYENVPVIYLVHFERYGNSLFWNSAQGCKHYIIIVAWQWKGYWNNTRLINQKLQYFWWVRQQALNKNVIFKGQNRHWSFTRNSGAVSSTSRNYFCFFVYKCSLKSNLKYCSITQVSPISQRAKTRPGLDSS